MSRFRNAKGRFWIVASDIAGMSPNPYIHSDREAAFAEAERLTRMVGGKFYVFEALGTVQRTDVVTDVFTEDSIPF